MAGGFPNNFLSKIETALRRAQNDGVLLLAIDGRLESLATNRQNRRKFEAIFRDTPGIVIGWYEIDHDKPGGSLNDVRAAMLEDCAVAGVEL